MRSKRAGQFMGEYAIEALVVGFLAWVIWAVYQSRYVFVIRIENGRPLVRKGQVTAAFLGRVAETCRNNGVARGWIGGVQRGRRIALRFSRDFPSGCQQQLRNEWQIAG